MDKGAARSKKRSRPSEAPAGVQGDLTSHSAKSHQHGSGRKGVRPVVREQPVAGPSTTSDPVSHVSHVREGGKERKFRDKRNPNPENNPDQFKPKAIRTAAALIFSQAPFELPPPAEMLSKVTRIDLSGSAVEDVGWLAGLQGVTWLSLAGCKVHTGWEAVGSLVNLAVLNISDCGLDELASSLKGLTKLKAIVAMNNPWRSLDENVVSSWPELNSLIVSHSLELTTLPKALSSRYHLNKLTFSHCPRLTISSIPDLSALPLLRDVKMNNLPLLTALPAHIASWGTGDLSLADATGKAGPSTRKGDGLAVLDLGNCSLSWDTVSSTFQISSKSNNSSTVAWKHLRSLTLHSNPLGNTHPKYSELLQSAKSLPALQIIDSRRVVERKKKGELSETREERVKRERREAKERPSGINAMGLGGKNRMAASDQPDQGSGVETGVVPADANGANEKQGKKARKRKHGVGSDAKESIIGTGNVADSSKIKKRRHDDVHIDVTEPTSKKVKRKGQDSMLKTARTAENTLDPSTIAPTKQRRANETSVAEIVEVVPTAAEPSTSRSGGKEKKRSAKEGKVIQEKKTSGGVDLRAVFKANEADEGSGLGVGGW